MDAEGLTSCRLMRMRRANLQKAMQGRIRGETCRVQGRRLKGVKSMLRKEVPYLHGYFVSMIHGSRVEVSRFLEVSS
eukprot:765912-Hanusia_phi.AAC.2